MVEVFFLVWFRVFVYDKRVCYWWISWEVFGYVVFDGCIFGCDVVNSCVIWYVVSIIFE